MRRWIFSMVFMLAGWITILHAQSGVEGQDFPPYPEDRMANSEQLKTLPLRVNNSAWEYFPPILNQLGWSCNQANSIGYMFTYELNRKREVKGELPENQYSPSYAWNFLTSESTTSGVSYFDTWEIIKANGCPNIIDFPYTRNTSTWMNGYDKYFRAMKNKAIENYSISVSNYDGLRALKYHLFNHNDSYKFGGLANIQIASSGMKLSQLPSESINAGYTVITSFGVHVGHALTIVGYDDQVKFDFNHDGLYTNNVDLNDDGIIDMQDWEVGALLVVNSWGKSWGNLGKAYLPYRLLTRFGYQGGIWNRSVHVVEVLHEYSPLLTLKLEIAHSNRDMLRITVGCSNDLEATYPDYIHTFPMLNYHGGPTSLGVIGQHMEMGLDLTPMISHLEAGKPAKFFVMIDERDQLDTDQGVVYNYSIISYLDNDTVISERKGQFPILPNQTTLFEVDHQMDFEPVEVNDYEIHFTDINKWLSIPLYASGIKGRGNWELVPDYKEDTMYRKFPEITGEFIPFYASVDGYVELELPFDFPFYGEEYNKLYTDDSGYLYLQTQYQNYPYSVDKNLLFKQRKSIVPFGQNLFFYGKGNGLYYEPSDSLAKIFWDCSALIGSQIHTFQFACFLYPDGLIEFHYGETGSDEPSRSVFHSAISRGNGKQVFTTSPSVLGMVSQNQIVKLRPYNIPPKTKIESNSYLFTRPEEKNQLYEIKIKVTDGNYQEAYGVIPISTVDFSGPDLQTAAYPNPFTESTTLSIVVKEKSQLRIDIFDLSGRPIRSLIDQEYEKGIHLIEWDGSTNQGSRCKPGAFLIRVYVGEEQQSIKILKNAC